MNLPNPSDLIAARNASNPGTTPVLPNNWKAQVLLTPYGDGNPPMANYSQLVVADISYVYQENTPSE